MADLYSLLDLAPDASAEEVKRAYRAKARQLHPDAGGDEEEFKAVTRAYEVLSDPDRRARYDRFGDDGQSGASGAGDPFGFGGGFGGGLSDVIDAFFGGGATGGFGGSAAGRRAPQNGRDVLVRVGLSLEEIAEGSNKPVEVEVAGTCDVCAGTGSSSSAKPHRCAECGGSGSVQRIVRTAFGQLATATTCPRCEGAGTVVSDPCAACRGEGRRQQAKKVTVKIPPGVEDGDRLRVSGAGEAGRHGTAAGDLYVEVAVLPHEVFERDGRDLWCEVTVPFTQAALGTDLRIPTVTGDEIEVTVHAGTQPGDVLTSKRAGLPSRNGYAPGDLHVRVNVDVPRRLDDEETELLRRFAELRGEDVPEHGRGVFSRLRDAFR